MLWDGAGNDDPIQVELAAGGVAYELSFFLAAGRIDPLPGERLVSSSRDLPLIKRVPGATKASLYDEKFEQAHVIDLREPEKISLGLFLDFNGRDEEAAHLDRLLRFVRFYRCRSFLVVTLKRSGSESSHQARLWVNGKNAFSVLRNLQDKRNVDARYNTIMEYMAKAFPAFHGIVLEQTGPSSVYASFQEKGLSEPILASGISDGVIQMLLLLLALFSEGDREAVLLFEEPEVSLHPWAISVFAQAIRDASTQWGKQVIIATHSPVLISQFEPEDILVAHMEQGRARFDRLSDIEEVQELLEEYAPGSLYMSQAIAPQGPATIEKIDT